MAHFILFISLLSTAWSYPGPYPPGGSCNVAGPSDSICIAAPFGSGAVLQRKPEAAAVTGSVPEGYGVAPMKVTVTLTQEDNPFTHVVSVVVGPDLTWKVLLPPRPAFGTYSLNATCSAGCSGDNATKTVNLANLTFGDVFVCSGQSNMQLMMDYTFEVNATVMAIKAGKYHNIRVFAGPLNFDFATNRSDIWVIAGSTDETITQFTTGAWRHPRNLLDPIPNGHNEAPWYNTNEFGKMYATCWYTFQALTDSLIAKGETPPPFGLIAVAVGGTKIAQWVEWDAQAECKNVTCCDSADCTQSPMSNPQPYRPIDHEHCPGNAQLYNGLIAPLVNTTIKGWLWYQGENSLCYDAGNYQMGTGYGCMMAKLVSSWRKVWSAVPGTTNPLAPFGIVSLADATDEGLSVNMRQFRWSQTANYGVLPNPAMPATFLAEAYDLGDPWTTPFCGNSGTYGGAPYKGKHCCVDKGVQLGSECVGDHRGLYALNGTRDWAGLGTLHPRLKKPIGERLAYGLHAMSYGGTAIANGPVFAGCTVAETSMTLTFNLSLLRGETVMFNSANTIEKESTALYVLVNDSATADPNWIASMTANHHPHPDNGGDYPDYLGPYSNGNEMGVFGWVAAAAKRGSLPNTLTVDLSHLPHGAKVSAIRYGVGSGAFNATRDGGDTRICCGPTVDTTLEPCSPASCPIKAATLPASPFFALVDAQTRKCRCFAPQICDGDEVAAPAFV